MKQVKQGTRSSEFWIAAVFGVVLIAFKDKLAIDAGTMEALTAVLATYVGGRSVLKAADVYAANRDVPPAAGLPSNNPAPVSDQPVLPTNAPNLGAPGAPAPRGQG